MNIIELQHKSDNNLSLKKTEVGNSRVSRFEFSASSFPILEFPAGGKLDVKNQT